MFGLSSDRSMVNLPVGRHRPMKHHRKVRRCLKDHQNEPPPDDDDPDEESSVHTSDIRSMLRQRIKKEGDGWQRPKSSLGSVRIEEYWGERSRYVKWKRTIQAQQCLHGLESQELAMLVYLSTRKEARDVVEQHPVTAYTGPGGLQLLWRVLDEAFGESEAELFERADKELEKYRRAPGESIAHYLAEMRRLRAQYSRVDPDTKLSDRAWAQKLLQKASLGRKDRYDVYYSAGATYDPVAIEKALRVRCQKTHEDEWRTPSRTPHRERDRDREEDPKPNYFKKKKVFIKKRVHTTHVAEGGEDEDEEMPMEQSPPEEEPAGEVPPDEDEEADEEEDNVTSDGEMEEGELKEAFAAGWKAKQKVADFKKHRGWKSTYKKGERGHQTIDARKKATACSSCGKAGHWRGDPECPNVANGRDQPHQPHKKATMVHYTCMVSGGGDSQCPQCHWPILETAKFCGECGYALHPDERMSRQPKRQGDEDGWEEVDGPPERFGFQVKKNTLTGAKPKATPKALVPPGHVRLQGQELLAALPNMTKEEKKALQAALQDEDDKDIEKRRQLYKNLMAEWSHYDDYEPTARELFPDDPDSTRFEAWQARRKGYADQDPSAAASGSQMPVAPAPKQDKPKAVKEKELLQFRRGLYEQQLRHNRCIPSTAASWPNDEQNRCPHHFDDLKWSANAEGHFARCRACDLKHVIYYSNRHGTMMVSMHSPREGVGDKARVWIREDERAAQFQWVNKGGPPQEQVKCRVTKDVHGHCIEIKYLTGQETMKELTQPLDGPPRTLLTEFSYDPMEEEEPQSNVHFIQAQKPGLAIADSGCRNSVGGEAWHQHFQQALREHGIPWSEVAEKEVYKFGAGAPIVSKTACLYPVLVHGHPDIVRMSTVGGGGASCPGLIGPGELSRWNAVFHFKEKQMELNGVKKEMRLTATRHPGIELMDLSKEGLDTLRNFWSSEGAEEKRKILMDAPQSYAFLTGSSTKVSEEEEETSSQADEESEEEKKRFHEKDDRTRKVEEWTQQLEDLGVIMVPSVPAAEEKEEESSTASDTDGHDSSTSHEKGVDFLTESESDEDPMPSRSWVSEDKPMYKGLKHRLGHALNEIKQCFKVEEKIQRKRKEEDGRKHQEEGPSGTKRGVKRKRPWTMVEIFSWTCAITMVASLQGWHASEPISLPHWDLLKSKDRKDALTYLNTLDPDAMVIAWPCTVWSPLQEFGHKSPWQRERLEERREEQRELLGFVRDASHDQRRRAGLLLGENPKPSSAWKEPLIIEAFDGMGSAITDMCQYGLRIPGGGPFLRKRTRLEGTPELVHHLARTCPQTHQHTPVLGGMRYGDKWMNVSDFAGGYTTRFAQAVVKQAERILEEKGRQPEVLITCASFPEEDLDEEEGEGEKEVKKERPQSWKIQQLHNRLGHPTNATLSKMLSLAGATRETIQLAQQFQCPTCQETQAPARYLKASAEMRTTIFGRELQCDLKYLHDHKNNLFVALSMVDGATSFHQAVLLRNRAAEHVARKCLRHWISLYGSPQTIVLDQGGEFDGYFTGFLEQHGIFSKVSGSKSAWQHGFAERHGALLGIYFPGMAVQSRRQKSSQRCPMCCHTSQEFHNHQGRLHAVPACLWKAAYVP